MCRLIFYLSIDTSVLQYSYLSILPNMQSVLQYCSIATPLQMSFKRNKQVSLSLRTTGHCQQDISI